MNNHRATRLVAVLIIVGGLAVAPLLDNSDPVDAPAIQPSPFEPATFEVQWLRGELKLAGHTSSSDHERDLLQVAASSYSGATLESRFEPLGIVPGHWDSTTVQVIYLLAETVSARATLTENELVIQGVTVDQLGWQNRLQALKKALPPHLAVSSEALVVDASVSIRALCDRAFTAFEAGPINFEESSATFRNSAYPRLDRLIALASACPDSAISITGHTDASGSDSWNQRLSLERANAVGDYLVNGRVDKSRLRISGVGSAVAIADNATRYGRSLNRRIEISLSGNTSAIDN